MEDVFKALGDPTRLRIMSILAENGETCVCDIVDELNMGQPAVSHHVAKLKQAGLLHSRKDGQWVYYSLNTEALEAGPLTLLSKIAEASRKSAEKASGNARKAPCGRPNSFVINTR